MASSPGLGRGGGRGDGELGVFGFLVPVVLDQAAGFLGESPLDEAEVARAEHCQFVVAGGHIDHGHEVGGILRLFHARSISQWADQSNQPFRKLLNCGAFLTNFPGLRHMCCDR